ncbi:MAG: hypothetical protein Q9174_005491, partial [Haloplaca sp. 1 TL-2023]
YCSAYLRNETCNNRECTFLHEQGKDNDSFSRQDLSSINAISTQRPAGQPSSSSSAGKATQPAPQPQPPPQQAPQVLTAASHSMARQGSRDEPMSRSDSGDGSALPSSASWAAKNAQSESRRSSKPSSVSASSPQVQNSQAVPSQTSNPSASAATAAPEQPSNPPSQPSATIPEDQALPRSVPQAHPLDRLLQTVMKSDFKFVFDRSQYSEEMLREIDAIPPLFDDNGGLVRYRLEKAREKERLKQEAEEAEERKKNLTALTTADEDEAPASGSLQLGGEPETDDGRQSVGGRQSSEPRSAIQPPLSGTFGSLPFSNSAFGNNQMFNGRSLTPQQQQQLLMLRGMNQQSPVNAGTQQSFTGQTSQHHHQQSNPFQNQGQEFSIPGHTRQASRFTFANDTPSASTAVKPNAAPQLMAQQSAMMPSVQNKNFQHQNMQPSSHNKTHFYSGVQGPPPGLKSSGTPPISGGGMFGQGHGFTQPPSGLNTMGGTKNTNEQLMQNLLRGRGDNMNGPGPDIGKRELQFSSAFQNPSTSHAPASALLSSLYGQQLGAYNGYQEHGLAKQKKKGKKHRHANTSSSGGGGIVDLADPSILQARMHHGGATGQGQMGLQGQESSPFVSSNTTPTTLGSLARAQTTTAFEVIPLIGPRSKKSTPAPPPVPLGLSLPQDFPPLAAPQAPPPTTTKPQKKAAGGAPASVITPVIPVVPSQSTKAVIAGAAKDKSVHAVVTKDNQSTQSPLSTDLQPSSKAESAMEGLPTDKVDSLEPQTGIKANDPAATTKKEQKSKESSAVEAKAAKKDLKSIEKPRPGNLNIDAVKSQADGNMDSLDEPQASASVKDATLNSIATTPVASQPQTPVTAVSQASAASTAKSGQPRTIRVVQTSRNETASKGAVAPITKDATSTASAIPSRRGSLSSINPPGTPASERISDNASLASASLSRADSPPPGKVGTASLRHVSKSQQKKERQRAKQAEEVAKSEEAPAKALVEEPVQAPITSRKKKQKKPGTTTKKGTSNSTPAVTRPSSPHDEGSQVKDEPFPVTPGKDGKKSESKATASSEMDNPGSPAGTSTTEQPHKSTLSAAAIFAQLQKSGEISANAMDIFKPVQGLNHRFDVDPHAYDLQMPEASIGLPPPLTEEQNKQIDLGEP